MKFSKQSSQYESDFTKFIKDMKAQDPELERKQREGRAIWWDKGPIDLDERKRQQESRVNQQAYVYQSK
ncbi:DUF3460 family protein [Oxalobacteraceae bacterium OM1]|nr:DUF3460 family protein [Oxalobacteraceae bacterium OM1]